MGSDSGGSFPFDFELNGFSFGSKSKGKLSPRSYPIQFERKWIYSFLSVKVAITLSGGYITLSGHYIIQLPYNKFIWERLYHSISVAKLSGRITKFIWERI